MYKEISVLYVTKDDNVTAVTSVFIECIYGRTTSKMKEGGRRGKRSELRIGHFCDGSISNLPGRRRGSKRERETEGESL